MQLSNYNLLINNIHIQIVQICRLHFYQLVESHPNLQFVKFEPGLSSYRGFRMTL